jgi:uncharacterized protein
MIGKVFVNRADAARMGFMLELPELSFPLTPSESGVWRLDEASGAVIGAAHGHTDLYVNPAGEDSTDAESMLNGATLVGTPPAGDFQLSARVTVDFRSQYDAGVLIVWIDDHHWAKFCFEFSPAQEPMVVSVVTREISDDANAFVVPDRSVWLRISRIGRVYAFHASTDGETWILVRVFGLGDALADHKLGFEVQSPTGDGCTTTFTDIRFASTRLEDLRDGS